MRERESEGESKSFGNEEIRNKPPVVSVVVLSKGEKRKESFKR